MSSSLERPSEFLNFALACAIHKSFSVHYRARFGYQWLMSLLRPCVNAMRAYQPGEQPAAGSKIIKLNTNENPYPPSPTVKAAIVAELVDDGARLRLYSDPSALALRQAASERFGLPISQILQGNGSDELIALLMRGLLEPGESVAYPYPTYVLYETIANAQGAPTVSLDFASDFSLPAGMGDTGAKIVFIANPNSPAGTSASNERLLALAKSMPESLLVVDEAYAEFADSNALELVNQAPNLCVLRTFSKSQSLAGMRVGLLFGSEELVTGLGKVRDSYNLDRLAIAAATACLKDPDWTRANVARVLATRARLSAGMTELGATILPSQANFVMARLGSAERARGAYQALKADGILVRYFSLRLLDDAIRITVGTDEQIDAFLAAMKRYVSDS